MRERRLFDGIIDWNVCVCVLPLLDKQTVKLVRRDGLTSQPASTSTSTRETMPSIQRVFVWMCYYT